MKYIVVLGDGMADQPISQLADKTPLEYAKTKTLDRLSRQSEIGMVHTIPEGMNPGSDTANLSVMGYNPQIYYSGRSPLEALSIGVSMHKSDVALRCNFVTLTEEEGPFEERTILDHSSDEITTDECSVLLEAVRKELENGTYKFYMGTSYRHCVIWDRGKVVELTPPHDVLDQRIGEYLPKEEVLCDMMRKSYEILKNHPLNLERKERGLRPANCCWFWGAGTKPNLPDFQLKTGKRGAMISAVDLLKGIAVGVGMKVYEVKGANGGLHTNYEGKTQAAVTALLEDDMDFVYIHIEAPDEMGHQGSVEKKVQAIEYLDARVIGPLTDTLDKKGIDYRLLVLPDHPTPICVRTHTGDSVPYLLYDGRKLLDKEWDYNEKDAEKSGNYIAKGYDILDYLFENESNKL